MGEVTALKTSTTSERKQQLLDRVALAYDEYISKWGGEEPEGIAYAFGRAATGSVVTGWLCMAGLEKLTSLFLAAASVALAHDTFAESD